jgi:glycosyltransferase involved in cell wall biosynthesis
MISILIPILDDANSLFNTIDSIEKSTDNNLEIIIIDSSVKPIEISKNKDNINIKIIRQETNIGPAKSRQLAAEQAKYDVLFMADSHTYFPNGWDEILINSFSKNRNKISAFPVAMSRTWDKRYFDCFATYYGSDIYIKHFNNSGDFFDSYIRYDKKNKNLNAIKLAAYGIDKEYFLNLRGFSDIKQWGSDELCLSIKVHLSDGNIELLEDKKFIHVHDKQFVIRNMAYIYYNKIRLAKTFMTDDVYKYFLSIIPKNNNFINEAWKLIEADKEEIQEYKNFYRSIFKKDFSSIASNIIE